LVNGSNCFLFVQLGRLLLNQLNLTDLQ